MPCSDAHGWAFFRRPEARGMAQLVFSFQQTVINMPRVYGVAPHARRAKTGIRWHEPAPSWVALVGRKPKLLRRITRPRRRRHGEAQTS